MEYRTRKNLNLVLMQLPQIENQLTETQERILNYLKARKSPTLPKTISRDLELDYNSTRARLFELVSMGYVFQPNRIKLTIAELDETGTAKYDNNFKKCGYMVLTLKN